MRLPEIGGGQADVHSDFLGLLPAFSLPHPFPMRGDARTFAFQAGRTKAGREPRARQHRGQEIQGGSYSPAAPCPAPCRTCQGTTIEEDRAPGLLGPTFSRQLATQGTRAPESSDYQPSATPATFEFQPPLPFSPPSALRGQSSPSPQPRANRSALRLPRPHPAKPAPCPSCFAGLGRPPG